MSEAPNEALIGTPGGVLRAFACKRVPEGERWQLDRILNMTGTPQRPLPTRPGLNIPIRVPLPDIPLGEGAGVPEVSEKEIVPRRRVITMRELEKYGFTPGCIGCEAKRRGGVAKSGHNEECRRRIEAKMNDDELGRAMLDQTRQKFVEHTARKIEKDEDRKRKM